MVAVFSDMKGLGLGVDEAQDRQLWRRKIFGKTSEPCVHGKTDANVCMYVCMLHL